MRRVTLTWLKAPSTPAAFRLSSPTPPSVSDTSPMPIGLRPSVPLKITSAISPPRSALADCSPSTQRMASETLDLPQPFGPTMAVTPGWKLSEVLSAKDLNPKTVRFLRYMSFAKTTKPALRCKVENHKIQGRARRAAQLIGEEPRFALCRRTFN